MELSIIIVNWNTKNLLQNCLESIFLHVQKIDFEVWVVDNASEDGSSTMLRDEFPQVNVIQSPENIGFANANNLAMPQCSGKYILLLNSDTLVTPGSIEILRDYLEERNDVGAVGPLLRNPDGSLQTSCYPFPTLMRETWRMFHLDIIKAVGIYQQEKWSTFQTREVDSLKGACILMRRDALVEDKLFDPGFFMYTEEIDLCYRIHHSGWKLVWMPASEIVHLGGQSTRLAAVQMFQSLYKTKILFFRKHYGNRQATLYKFMLFMASIPRIALGWFAYFEPAKLRQEHQQLASQYRNLVMALPRI